MPHYFPRPPLKPAPPPEILKPPEPCRALLSPDSPWIRPLGGLPLLSTAMDPGITALSLSPFDFPIRSRFWLRFVEKLTTCKVVLPYYSLLPSRILYLAVLCRQFGPFPSDLTLVCRSTGSTRAFSGTTACKRYYRSSGPVVPVHSDHILLPKL